MAKTRRRTASQKAPTSHVGFARVAAGPGEATGIVTPRARAIDALPRIDLVDVLRGLAIATMIAYHVCFDLTYVGWAHWAMLDDRGWIAWRSSIVASFLFVVGVSLALRDDRERRRGTTRWLDRSFLRRWAEIAGAAVLVTAGSALLFPATFIYFGVLHFVAVALWLCRRAPRRPGLALVLAAAALAIGLWYANPVFDPRTIDWIGFATRKPPTEDYVPLFPWLGVVLAGCAAGGLWARHGFRLSTTARSIERAVPSRLRRLLATMGRWSLTIYLVHQPLLLGTMTAIHRFL